MVTNGMKQAVAEDVIEYAGLYKCSLEDAVVDIYYSMASEDYGDSSLTEEDISEILSLVGGVEGQ